MRTLFSVPAGIAIIALTSGAACQVKPVIGNAPAAATLTNASAYCPGSIEEPWWLASPPPSELTHSVTIVLAGDILFDRDSAELSPGSISQLGIAVRLSEKHPTASVTVHGYTDSDGKSSTNIPLSTARSKAVARWLQSQGVSPRRITTKAWGDTHPVAPNTTAENKARNRRVELVFSKPPGRRAARVPTNVPSACRTNTEGGRT